MNICSFIGFYSKIITWDCCNLRLRCSMVGIYRYVCSACTLGWLIYQRNHTHKNNCWLQPLLLPRAHQGQDFNSSVSNNFHNDEANELTSHLTHSKPLYFPTCWSPTTNRSPIEHHLLLRKKVVKNIAKLSKATCHADGQLTQILLTELKYPNELSGVRLQTEVCLCGKSFINAKGSHSCSMI